MHKESTKKSVNTEKVDSPKPPILCLTLDPHRTTANILGMLYISRKKEHGGDRKSEESMYQNDTLNAREVVAKETGVSPATIMRDAAYAEAAQLTQSTLCEPRRTPR